MECLPLPIMRNARRENGNDENPVAQIISSSTSIVSEENETEEDNTRCSSSTAAPASTATSLSSDTSTSHSSSNTWTNASNVSRDEDDSTISSCPEGATLENESSVEGRQTPLTTPVLESFYIKPPQPPPGFEVGGKEGNGFDVPTSVSEGSLECIRAINQTMRDMAEEGYKVKVLRGQDDAFMFWTEYDYAFVKECIRLFPSIYPHISKLQMAYGEDKVNSKEKFKELEKHYETSLLEMKDAIEKEQLEQSKAKLEFKIMKAKQAVAEESATLASTPERPVSGITPGPKKSLAQTQPTFVTSAQVQRIISPLRNQSGEKAKGKHVTPSWKMQQQQQQPPRQRIVTTNTHWPAPLLPPMPPPPPPWFWQGWHAFPVHQNPVSPGYQPQHPANSGLYPAQDFLQPYMLHAYPGPSSCYDPRPTVILRHPNGFHPPPPRMIQIPVPPPQPQPIPVSASHHRVRLTTNSRTRSQSETGLRNKKISNTSASSAEKYNGSGTDRSKRR